MSDAQAAETWHTLSVRELKEQLRKRGCTDFSGFLEKEHLLLALQAAAQNLGGAYSPSDLCCCVPASALARDGTDVGDFDVDPQDDAADGTTVRDVDVGAGLLINVVTCESAFTNFNTGARLWDGSVLLARHVVANLGSPTLSNARVVELGCGTGLAGIAAGTQGARVFLTDLSSVLEQTTRANLEANLGIVRDRGGCVTLQPLAWGEDVGPLEQELPLDYILAADVVYRPELSRLLLETIRRLSSGGTVVLLSYCRRRSEEEWFFSSLCEDFECSVVAGRCGDMGADAWRGLATRGEGAVFRFTRKANLRDAAGAG